MNKSDKQGVKLGGYLESCDHKKLNWVEWAMPDAQFKLLHADQASGCFALLVRFLPNAQAPIHRHIGAVEGLVLDGSFFYTDQPELIFKSGTYIWESDDTVHQPISEKGAVMFLIFHGAVEGLDGTGKVTGRVNWKWHVEKWLAAGNHYEPTGVALNNECVGGRQ
jgi:2,4'-dihydroxyacetophenone dioxygenase